MNLKTQCFRSGVRGYGCLLGLCGGLTVAGTAEANERHFTYTYETATLPAGSFELEPWATLRLGRAQYYTGTDYRLEFEGGLTDRLQTALYLNGSAEASAANGVLTTSSAFTGFSSEWKYRILDRDVAPVGLALYGEFTVAADSFDAEGKVLLDRWFGNLLVAANFVADEAWLFTGGATQHATEFEVELAAGYRVHPRWTVGFEIRDDNRWTTDGAAQLTDAVLYAGPTVAFSAQSFWIAASILPQIHAFAGSVTADGRNLTSEEAVQARILMGAHL